MADPTIADKKPSVQELEPGTYHWCACGKSNKQPFCDETHKGTEFHSLHFDIKEKQTVALCQCKNTKNPPFCDGTHSKL